MVNVHQRNGSKGGGPRTAAGKMVSRMNARKHGLSIPVMIDRDLRKTAFDIAHAIAGKDASDAILRQALIVAECELMLHRVRQARAAAIERAKAMAQNQQDALITTDPANAFVKALPVLGGMERYERRAFSRKKKALVHLHDLQQIAQHSFD